MTISEYALKFIGRSYIWGGDGSGKCGGGFDCSGLVLECLWAFGKLQKGDLTAQGIHDKLLLEKGWRQGLSVKEGDVLFFGKDLHHITHVALAIGGDLMVEAPSAPRPTSLRAWCGCARLRGATTLSLR